MKTWIAGLAAAAALTGPAAAHHSFAMFDTTKVVVLKGTLISFSYLNPHAWISVMGNPDGKAPAVRWDVEATSPLTLNREGIKADTIKPGDKVTVAIRPLRDGRMGGSLVFLVTADGMVHGAKPSEFGLEEGALKP